MNEKHFIKSLESACKMAQDTGVIARNNINEISAFFFKTGFWAGELKEKLKYTNKPKKQFIEDEITSLRRQE